MGLSATIYGSVLKYLLWIVAICSAVSGARSRNEAQQAMLASTSAMAARGGLRST
jgi:hypothetical protein